MVNWGHVREQRCQPLKSTKEYWTPNPYQQHPRPYALQDNSQNNGRKSFKLMRPESSTFLQNSGDYN